MKVWRCYDVAYRSGRKAVKHGEPGCMSESFMTWGFTVDISMRIWQLINLSQTCGMGMQEGLDGQGSVECTGRSMPSSEATASLAVSLDMHRNDILRDGEGDDSL